MRVFIDANILLDVLQNREPFVRDSATIWKLCETEQIEGYISVLTFSNLVYIMRKELDPMQIREVFQKLSLIFRFVELTPSDISHASQLQWNDFEDALQSVTAERIHADFIVTRNVRDFLQSKVSAFAPSELLMRIGP